MLLLVIPKATSGGPPPPPPSTVILFNTSGVVNLVYLTGDAGVSVNALSGAVDPSVVVSGAVATS